MFQQRLKKDQADNCRTATNLTVHLSWNEGKDHKSISRCVNLASYVHENLALQGYEAADAVLTSMGHHDGMYDKRIISLGLVASKMVDGVQKKAGHRIDKYFRRTTEEVEIK